MSQVSTSLNSGETDELGAGLEQERADSAAGESLPMPGGGSLKDRLQARRSELQRQTTEDFDVPGYEGVLVARYQLLDYKTLRGIISRSDKVPDPALQELNVMADTLIHACVDLLEYRSDGQHVPLGYRWGARAADALFGVAGADGLTARQATIASFPRDTLLMRHGVEVSQWQEAGGRAAVDEVIEDELEDPTSPASS